MLDPIIGFLKRIKDKLDSFVDGAPVSGEEKTRLQHYAIFLVAGMPTMLIYGGINLYRSNFLLCVLIFISGISLFGGLLVLRNLKDGRIVYRINCCLFGLLIIYMMLMGGEGGSKILWMYTFPLIAFFLFGKKEGLLWTATLLFIIVFTFWGPLSMLTDYAYGLQFKTRFFTTYLIVSAITYWFEYSRFHYRLDLEEKNRKLEQEKSNLNHEISERRRLEKSLRRLASTDFLTGVNNRRHFMELAGKEFDRITRYNSQISFASLDIDHFKNINDTYGHPVGDEVIKGLAQYCNMFLRKTDILGRLGGEEFGILLVETNLQETKLVIARLLRKISELRLPIGGEVISFTVSIGVTSVKNKEESLESIMKRADDALYLAKKGGRNRMICL